MNARSYKSPESFKHALDQRLRNAARTSGTLQRKRQLLVFERFLARAVREFGDAVTLKGGMALELRIDHARTTRDVDLRISGSPINVLSRLQAACRNDLGDFMTFEIAPDQDHPEIQNDGMKYEGQRFRAHCTIAGKPYADPFGVDVAFGDPLIGDVDSVHADDMLAFASIAPPTIKLYPIETHLAEKLHAYTMPRTRPNSRVKDLPDIALLATVRALDAQRLRGALDDVFAFRDTHLLPLVLPDPIDAWRHPYAAMARENALRWTTLDEVTAAARVFLDPVLAGALTATWDPDTWTWRTNS